MKTVERPSRRGFLFYATITLSMTLIAMLANSCSPGVHTTASVSGSVKVDPQNCKESRGVPDADAGKEAGASQASFSDIAVLDCLSGAASGTVQISFPRKEWNSILASSSGRALVDAGPGK